LETHHFSRGLGGLLGRGMAVMAGRSAGTPPKRQWCRMFSPFVPYRYTGCCTCRRHLRISERKKWKRWSVLEVFRCVAMGRPQLSVSPQME
jgi:hypothetical protein